MKKISVIILVVMMIFSVQVVAGVGGLGNDFTYATTHNVDLDNVGETSAIQGDKNVIVSFQIKNLENNVFEFDSAQLTYSPSEDISVTTGSTGSVSLKLNETAIISFYLNISKNAESGDRYGILVLKKGNTEVLKSSATGRFTISEKLATPEKGTGTYVATADINHSIKPTGGFTSGIDNEITFDIFNNGNSIIKNATVAVTLPEGLSVYNSSNSQSLGYISTGSKRSVSFPITVNDDAVQKNYAIEVALSGLNYSNQEVSTKKTFYVPVVGEGGTSSIKNLEITNINIPNKVLGREDFTLSFKVENRNNAAVKNLKVYIEVPEGILNKTKRTFIEPSILAGGIKDYSVTLFASDASKEQSYPIKIAVEPVSGNDSGAKVVMQYADVYVTGSGNTKTPQLMVDRYNYGGTYVQAGSEFRLNLGLYNTSGKNLSNIKVTLNSTDGIFIPVDSSNSFFIDNIDKKGHRTNSVMLSVKPGAEQKTTSLEVNMTYEDGSGNEFSSKDVISIPIMQETRLQVDEMIPPAEIYVGTPVSASVQFYNMGKTVLNNLRINATGNFDTTESISYFVGNMEAGKSDTYDFTIIPSESGPLEGQIIFTYEDVAGEQQTYAVPFTFQVMEAMPTNGEDLGIVEEENPKSKNHVLWIIGGVVFISGIVGTIIFRKIRKKKLHQEMEIDE